MESETVGVWLQTVWLQTVCLQTVWSQTVWSQNVWSQTVWSQTVRSQTVRSQTVWSQTDRRLSDCRLSDCRLSDCRLSDCRLSDCRLSGRKAVRVLRGSAKLREAIASSVMSVRPSVRVEQLGSYWTYFDEIWYLSVFRKSVKEIQVLLKSHKNNGYFTWRPIHIFHHGSLSSF
jgi:hypothetical protein